MYRNSTYVAFDAQSETDPTKSDIRYFNVLKAQSGNSNIDFILRDAHDKTSPVRDTSNQQTLEARIKDRLRNHSKNVLVILSDNTRKHGSMLSFEIEQAVDTYKLPLIIAYADVGVLTMSNDPTSSLSGRWPYALKKRIDNATAKAIHIPFKVDSIQKALSQFSVVSGAMPSGPLDWFRPHGE